MQSNSGYGLGQLTEEELRTNFSAYDRDGSGFITYDEIKQIYAKHNVSIADATLQGLFAKYDTDKNGRMSFEEFKVWVNPSAHLAGPANPNNPGQSNTQCKGLGLSNDELKLNFNNYDKDGNGSISFDEFKAVYEKYGAKMTPQVEEYVRYCDKNKDGKLSFDEFKCFMNGW